MSGADGHVVEKWIVIDAPVVLENAALLGRGIIVGSMLFLKQRLEHGELVYPFGTEHNIKIYYYVATRPQETRGAVVKFRQWLITVSANQRIDAP
ncbi:hypothetical protein V3D52_10985 [Pseudomonas putida]|uniref:hypothetical protein n=1 Tax=Pseudomonas putida TaxID=303 RepID=UPI0030CEA663